MASDGRFYQMQMSNRPVLNGDLGSLIKIEGLVVGGGGARAILTLPGCDLKFESYWDVDQFPPIYNLSLEEWGEWLRRSDDPEVLIMPEKAFHRKVRYEISGAVQQKIWVADTCRCVYCLARMGDVQLTIDHWMPLELGGANDTSNYLSACRRCNKKKGSMHPRDWCEQEMLNFDGYIALLSNRIL